MAKTALEIVLVDDGSPAASRQPGPPVDTPRVSAASRGTPAANEKSDTLAAAPATSPSEARADNPIARQAGQVASALEEVEEASLPLSSAFSELTTKVERLSDTLDRSDTEGSEAEPRQEEEESRPNRRGGSRSSSKKPTMPAIARTVLGPRITPIVARVVGSLGKLGTAGVVAGVALAGVAVAAGAMALTFRRVSQQLEAAVDRLAKYSPEIEIARAQADLSKQQLEMSAANKLGPDLAEFVRAQSQLEIQTFQIRMRLLKLAAQIHGSLQPFMKLFMSIGELLLEALRPGLKVLKKVADVIDDVTQWVKDKLGVGGDPEEPNNFLDDPFLRDWLGDLPKPPPPGANGGNGGVP